MKCTDVGFERSTNGAVVLMGGVMFRAFKSRA
jgi:hypothetical protein